MRKHKRTDPILLPFHSRQPSLQKHKKSSSRPNIHASSPIHTPAYYLSNPSSLEKKQSKITKKKGNKLKKKREEPTRETFESLTKSQWKNNLKNSFCKDNFFQKNSHESLFTPKIRQNTCGLNLRKAGQSYINLIGTFPRQQLNLTQLEGRQRVYFIDWLYCVSSQLLLRRNTFHLAVAIVDTYLDMKGSPPNKLQAVGAGALLLAVKQEQRANQGNVLNMLSGMGIGLSRQEIIQVESVIVLGLNFKLNLTTLPFWGDYFSQKWDGFIKRQMEDNSQQLGQLNDHLVFLRHSKGKSYKCYRETMQLLDACLMHSNHRQYQFPKLALAAMYLVVRIQTESNADKTESKNIYDQYFNGFKRKASPIFKDKKGFNSVFNEFTAEVCDFQITDLIPSIRWCAQFLNMGFTYHIDARAYESALNYEQFLRFTDYSNHIGDYFLQTIFK